MAYVIAEPCIGTKDNSCVEVCPVDCIHPTPDEPDAVAVWSALSAGPADLDTLCTRSALPAARCMAAPARVLEVTAVARVLAPADPVAARLVGHLERHIPEEMHGDEPGGELLDDLAALGYDYVSLDAQHASGSRVEFVLAPLVAEAHAPASALAKQLSRHPESIGLDKFAKWIGDRAADVRASRYMAERL